MSDYNPYRPPVATVRDAATLPNDGVELAGRGTRLGAAILDGVFYLLLVIPALLVMYFAADGNLDEAVIVIVALLAMVPVIIINLVLLARTGQTIAKKMLNIKIVRTDGSRAGLGRIFWLRMVVPGVIGNVPLIGAIFALADPLFIFQESRKCIHDLIADTIVIMA